MNPELELNLKTDFIPLYDKLNWGFECDDGWHLLLRDLSEKIMKQAKELNIKVGSDFSVEQAKEKYGTLRYYISPHFDFLESLIEEAEQVSEKTCEVCGKDGKFYPIPYAHQVRCEKHKPKAASE